MKNTLAYCAKLKMKVKKKITSLFLGFDFPLKDAGFILLCDKRKTDTSNKTMTLWENKHDRLSLKPSLMFSCKAEANS